MTRTLIGAVAGLNALTPRSAMSFDTIIHRDVNIAFSEFRSKGMDLIPTRVDQDSIKVRQKDPN